jgi:hypothetical protein
VGNVLRGEEGTKQLLETAPVGGRERGEELGLRPLRGLAGPPQHPVALGRRVQRIGAAIGGIAAPFHEPRPLELVHHRHHRGAVDPLLRSEALLGERPLLHEQDERAESLAAEAQRGERLLCDGTVRQVSATKQIAQLISYADVQYC